MRTVNCRSGLPDSFPVPTSKSIRPSMRTFNSRSGLPDLPCGRLVLLEVLQKKKSGGGEEEEKEKVSHGS